MGIGDRVREARKSRDLTQRDLARLAGVSRQTVENIESGLSTPDLSTLLRIAKQLGVSPASLIDFDGGDQDAAADDEDVREVLRTMRRLPPSGRRYVRDLVMLAARPMAAMTRAAS